jgi:3-isopropylmalate dehydrogenase
MMFRYSFGLSAEAQAVEDAVDSVLQSGWHTADIAGDGEKLVGTVEMGRLICEAIQ